MNKPRSIDTRTWLAGLAMQALAPTWQDGVLTHAEQCAKNAIEYADALMAALARSEPAQPETKLPDMAEQSQRHCFSTANPARCSICGQHFSHPIHIRP